MDPNLFFLDWDRTFEALAGIIVLSFMLERALALLFENRIFVQRASGKGVKEPIAFAVAFAVCHQWQFDAVSIVLLSEQTSVVGELVTAGVIAGGSKASLKLFHEILGVKSSAVAEAAAATSSAPKPTPSQPPQS